MEVKIDRSFDKDLAKLKSVKLNRKVAIVIRQTQAADSLSQIPHLAKP
jgi:hypothetical protein